MSGMVGRRGGEAGGGEERRKCGSRRNGGGGQREEMTNEWEDIRGRKGWNEEEMNGKGGILFPGKMTFFF